MQLSESAKELLENLRDEIQNLAGQSVRRMIVDFDRNTVGGIVQQKVGRSTVNRLIEFEENEK